MHWLLPFNVEGIRLLCIISNRASQMLSDKELSLPIQETKETCIHSLGQEDLLEKEMATHSDIPAWKIP